MSHDISVPLRLSEIRSRIDYGLYGTEADDARFLLDLIDTPQDERATPTHRTDCSMKPVLVQLEFLAPDEIDPDIFGEHVLCAIERSPEFFTEPDGMLRLVDGAA
jgi:hypothetical protein